MLIGLVGKLQSGKTTLANLIKEEYSDTILLAFADPLKEMILYAGICTREELWDKKTDFSRLMLQKIGTEIIRKQVDEYFWIDKIREKIISINKKKLIILHDLRFLNEANMIKNYFKPRNGTLIRIIRPSLSNDKEENNHLSETEQDLINVDFTIINDKTIDDLRNEAKKIINLHLDSL